MSQALEQMLDNTFVPNIGQDRLYQTIDRYAVGTTALYTPPPKPFGLMDPQPFQYGYDLDRGYQVKFKGPDETTLTYGKVVNGKDIIRELNGYECSMLDPILKNNFKKFP